MEKLKSMALQQAFQNRDHSLVQQLILCNMLDIDLATAACDTQQSNPVDDKSATKIQEMLQDLRRRIMNIPQLHQSVKKEDLAEVVAQVLDRGNEHVDSVSNEAETPLHMASSTGSPAMVESLIDLGANIDAKTKKGMTPLQMACFSNNYSVAHALVNRGADMQAMDSQGFTVLHAAAQNGWVTLLQFFMEQKNRPDVNARDGDGYTPLHRACQKDRQHVVQELIENGADCNALDANGGSSMHIAASNGYSKVAQMLLEKSEGQSSATAHGVSILEVVDRSGIRPLHHAVLSDSLTTTQVLLDGGANPNSPVKCSLGSVGPHQDATPLHLASEKGNKKMIDQLVEKGADLTMQDGSGNTPLHIAVKYGCTKAVKCLLQHGANVEAESSSGMTPLAVAEDLGMEDLAHILRIENRRRAREVPFDQVLTELPVKVGRATSPQSRMNIQELANCTL